MGPSPIQLVSLREKGHWDVDTTPEENTMWRQRHRRKAVMGRGKTEAEIGIMLWQVKEGVWPPEAGRGKEVS